MRIAVEHRRSQVPPPGAKTIDEVLAATRAGLHRLTPVQARHALDGGALLADIRPAAERAIEGQLPNSLIVERNVLEWRFDPRSETRLPAVTGYDIQVIVVCSEGYASSLAAAALRDLGLMATDVIGGFRAWRAAGLPTTG
jgi:rhodanese-related sulfurtransferase